jgi:hypothetical protein
MIIFSLNSKIARPGQGFFASMIGKIIGNQDTGFFPIRQQT